jgi:hypothetical protein
VVHLGQASMVQGFAVPGAKRRWPPPEVLLSTKEQAHGMSAAPMCYTLPKGRPFGEWYDTEHSLLSSLHRLDRSECNTANI